MLCKLMMFFSAGKVGWSEAYYTTASDLSAALQNGLDLGNSRSRLLSSPAVLEFLRASDTASTRASRLLAVGPGTQFPLPTVTYDSGADSPDVCALCTAYDSVRNVQRPIYLHGLPDNVYDVFSSSGSADKNTWFNILLGNFKGELESGKWLINERTRLGEGGTERPIKVVTVEYASNRTLIGIDNPIPGLVAGDLVTLYGLRGFAPNPGVCKVVNVLDTGLGFYVRWIPINPPVYNGGGTAVVYNTFLNPITAFVYNRITNRKIGRPFGVSRGRRKALLR